MSSNTLVNYLNLLDTNRLKSVDYDCSPYVKAFK